MRTRVDRDGDEMSARRGMRVLVLTVVVALSVSAIAVAGTQSYRGKVKGAGAVSFQLRAGKVGRFRASMTVSCVSATSGFARTEVYVIAPSGSAKLDRNGRFKFKVHLPKQQFVDAKGKVIATLYSVRAEVTGKVTGRNAEGTAKVTYNRNRLAGLAIVVVACTSGKPPIKWTARRK